MKKRLANLSGVRRANLQARDEPRDRAAKAAVRLGAFLCNKLHDDGLYLDDRKDKFNSLCAAGRNTSPACNLLMTQLPQIEQALSLTLQYYADTIVGSSQNYTNEVLGQQNKVLSQEVAARHLDTIAAYATVYLRHIISYNADGRINRQGWLASCKAGR
jgi:hypothetical protein